VVHADSYGSFLNSSTVKPASLTIPVRVKELMESVLKIVIIKTERGICGIQV